MKKILGLILAFCLVLGIAASAFAAKVSITKQPETSTTNKKGTVSFSIKTSGSVNSITWHFINPETGEDFTGKKLPSAVKGVKVANPNSKKITLKKVPESMHGWVVYCHINGNGYKLDSDKVMLLVNGLEPPAEMPAVMAPAEPEPAPEETTKDSKKDKEKDDSGNSDTGESGDTGDTEAPPPEKEPITVSCNTKALRMLDKSGAVMEGDPVSSLDFGEETSGSFMVTSAEPIKNYTVNGVLIEPTEPVTEFKILNVTAPVTLRLKINRVTASSVQVDESHMCKVVCTGCTFSYLRGGLRGVTEGEVPAGAPISIVADSADLAAKGYKINGAEPINSGMASFRYIVSDDVEIVAGE